MILTKKVRIDPIESVQQTLWEISGLCTQIWNVALEQRKDKKSWNKVNVYSQKRELTQIKKIFPEFKKPSSQVLQNILFDLDRGFKMFFTKQKQGDRSARPPKFKSRKYFFTQKYSQRDTAFSIKDNILKLSYGSKPSDWLTIDLPEGGYETVKTADILYDDVQKKWYACFTYFVEEQPQKEEGHQIYFDPGCKTTLTGIKTTGEFVEYDINPLRKINLSTYKLIDELKSRRDTKKKGSPRWRRLNKRIKKLFSKINTRSKVYLHTLANKILADHEDVKAFYIGDWKKQETLVNTGYSFVNKNINRAVQLNNPLQKLIGYLTYKAKLKGQAVEKFDERGTTRTCVVCKYVHKDGISPSKRTFVCESCLFWFSRDHHSCLNFLSNYHPALWQRLSESLPESSVRTSYRPFSLKPCVYKYKLAS